jgi:hypothetical protein
MARRGVAYDLTELCTFRDRLSALFVIANKGDRFPERDPYVSLGAPPTSRERPVPMSAPGDSRNKRGKASGYRPKKKDSPRAAPWEPRHERNTGTSTSATAPG